MKTIKLTLAALAIAATTATAYAISGGTEPEKSQSTDPPTIYYYGNQGGGTYIQIPATQANPAENCDTPEDNPCILRSLDNVPGGFQLGGMDQPQDIEPVEGSSDALWQFVQPQ